MYFDGGGDDCLADLVLGHLSFLGSDFLTQRREGAKDAKRSLLDLLSSLRLCDFAFSLSARVIRCTSPVDQPRESSMAAQTIVWLISSLRPCAFALKHFPSTD